VFLVSGKLLLLPEADHHVSPSDATPIPGQFTLSSMFALVPQCKNL
jgi:hypothetical protein